MKIIKRGLLYTTGLLTFTVVAGGVVGIWAGLVANSPDAVAQRCANLYLVQAVLLPLVLWMMVAAFLDQDRAYYDGWGSALGLTLIPAVLGSTILARLGFVGVATTLATVVNPGLDPASLVMAMPVYVTWSMVAIVFGCTVASAFLLAAWGRRKYKV